MERNSIKKMGWFILIAVLLAVGVHSLLIKGLRRYQAGGSFDVWNQIVHGDIDAELLVSGSSRALINFDCEAIQNVLGRSCYNIGLDGSKVNLDLARFKTFLKHNKKPKVLIQVTGIGDLAFGGFLRLHQYVPYLNEQDLYESLINNVPQVRYYKYIPLYGFTVFNKELIGRAVKGLLNMQDPETQWPQRPRVHGFLPVDQEWTDEYDKFKQQFPQGEEFEISPKIIRDLEELIEICQKENIRIVFVFPPAYYESIYSYVKNYKEIFQAYHELTLKHHIDFLDYSQAPMTHDKQYFYNSQHMNKVGAAKFSSILAEDIKLRHFFGD